MKAWRFITALMLCGLLAACHSTRPAVGPTGEESKWHTLEVPIKVTLSEPMRLSCSGKALLVRDSAVYVSLRMLGMELAYAYADADSTVLCDRYHKLYVSEALSRLLPGKYAQISALQQIMLGIDLPKAIADHITLENPLTTPAGTLNRNFSYSGAIKKSKLKISLTYNFDKARWDAPDFKLPELKLPRNARRVSPDDIMKILGENE